MELCRTQEKIPNGPQMPGEGARSMVALSGCKSSTGADISDIGLNRDPRLYDLRQIA